MRRLGQFEEENRQLKRLEADLTLDTQMLQDVLSKNSDASPDAGAGGASRGCLLGERAADLPGGRVLPDLSPLPVAQFARRLDSRAVPS